MKKLKVTRSRIASNWWIISTTHVIVRFWFLKHLMPLKKSSKILESRDEMVYGHDIVDSTKKKIGHLKRLFFSTSSTVVTQWNEVYFILEIIMYILNAKRLDLAG